MSLMNFPQPSVGSADLAWLREKLVLDAEAAGLLDVAFRVVDTPVGPLLLATTTVGL
ncbi:MAG: cysteine methyltransferase, partial [Rhodococcus sp. (in: high G+C Gram-positive bacteria)]